MCVGEYGSELNLKNGSKPTPTDLFIVESTNLMFIDCKILNKKPLQITKTYHKNHLPNKQHKKIASKKNFQ